MRVFFVLQAFAALTMARPKALPQVMDVGMVDMTPDPPAVTVPIGAESGDVSDNLSCARLPLGSGPVPNPDTAYAFLNYDVFSSAANDADEPTGYSNTFTNLQASSSAYGYLGFTTLSTYDTGLCAASCDKAEACSAFNICKCPKMCLMVFFG